MHDMDEGCLTYGLLMRVERTSLEAATAIELADDLLVVAAVAAIVAEGAVLE